MNFYYNKVLIIAFLFIGSCDYPIASDTIKNPKEYVWSADTLHYKEQASVQSLLGSIWGSSEKNVFVTGHSDSGNPIFHFNGVEWIEIDQEKNWIKKSFDPYFVFGFSDRSVWFAGRSQSLVNGAYFEVATIYEFNGDKWISHEIPSNNDLLFLWGRNSNEIFACGSYGPIIKFANNTYELDTIKIADLPLPNLITRSVIKYNDKLYALGYLTESHQNMLLKKENNRWIVLDSYIIGNTNDKWGDANFFLTSDNRLYTYGYSGVWEFNGVSWNKIIFVESSITGLTEYSAGKFLVAEYSGKLFTYSNGSLELIKDFGKNPYIYDIWANNKECFIVANKLSGGVSSKTLIYHGK